jgi:phosphoribosylformylglycinamidine cyclo-ligase
MDRVFNMGIGMIAVVAPRDADSVTDAVNATGVDVWTVGAVEAGQGVRYLG